MLLAAKEEYAREAPHISPYLPVSPHISPALSQVMLLAAKEEYAREGLPPAALDFDGLDNVRLALGLGLGLG